MSIANMNHNAMPTEVNMMLTVCMLIDGKEVKVKVLLLCSATQLDQMVSVALYNLTPDRGLTQPWCESSP